VAEVEVVTVQELEDLVVQVVVPLELVQDIPMLEEQETHLQQVRCKEMQVGQQKVEVLTMELVVVVELVVPQLHQYLEVILEELVELVYKLT
tara:strand:+ start:334 stop:609 length:276 start_codon:yes stop_codon:yes gene_type:complete